MPVRKNTAAKKTTAPAKKAAAKPAAKKSSASSGLSETQVEQVGKLVLAAIKGGDLDHMLVQFDDALTARINKHIKEQAAKKPAAGTKEKTASPAPKRESASTKKSLDLVANKNYKLGAPAKLKDAKVKYLKPSPKDASKVVVEMVTEKPGYAKGKRIVLPKSALVAAVR